MSAPQLWLLPNVTEQSALSGFEPKIVFPWHKLFLHKRGVKPATSKAFSELELPFTELFWLPFWFCRFKVLKADGDGQQPAPTSFCVLVCALTGTGFAALDNQPTSQLRPVAHPKQAIEPPFELNVDEAVPAAKDLVERFLGAGRRRSRIKQVSEQPEAPARWRYPVWVQTFERRAGKLDVKLLDALTGKSSDPAIRRAVLSALAQSPRLG